MLNGSYSCAAVAAARLCRGGCCALAAAPLSRATAGAAARRRRALRSHDHPRRGVRGAARRSASASAGASCCTAVHHPALLDWTALVLDPDGSPIGPIGLIGRNSLTPVYWCEWWGDTNGDAVWTAAWRGQRRPPPIESSGGDRKRNPACTREASICGGSISSGCASRAWPSRVSRAERRSPINLSACAPAPP